MSSDERGLNGLKRDDGLGLALDMVWRVGRPHGKVVDWPTLAEFRPANACWQMQAVSSGRALKM